MPEVDKQRDSFGYTLNEQNESIKSFEAKFNYPTFWQKIPLFAIKRVDEEWCDECEKLSYLIEKSDKSNKNHLIKIGAIFFIACFIFILLLCVLL
ncbi:MAG: hypothetical protein ACL7AX_00765 [Candidatus Arsenophonus phytopathogenicus]